VELPDTEIRLRLVEVVLPSASRVGMSDPSDIIETLKQLEIFVKGGYAPSNMELPTRKEVTPRTRKKSVGNAKQ